MRKHKVKSIIKKQGGHYQIICRDGMRLFWPQEYMKDMNVGTTITAYRHKNGQTVAYSWNNELRFIGSQPQYFDDAVKYIESVRFFDRLPLNGAIMRALHYRGDLMILPDTEKIAHNIVLLGIKKACARLR